MSTPLAAGGPVLTRAEASGRTARLGWRHVLGALVTQVRVASLTEAADLVVPTVVGCAGPDAGDRLWLDVRRDVVVVTLQSLAAGGVTAAETDAAVRVTDALQARGFDTRPASGPTLRGGRGVQLVEIAVDTQHAAAIRPFWAAVLGYTDEGAAVDGASPDAAAPGSWDALVDPLREGPAVWFQRMDAPRPQRGRIHLDVSVAHDEAPSRIAAALAAGGRLLSDAEAPAFWVLADADGNEVCITTWQGRD